MFRPDSGGCWGLRFPGGHQWHDGYDPVTVETCFRAAAAHPVDKDGVRGRRGTCIAVQIVCCVQRSLPCVDAMGKEESCVLTCGHRQRRYSLETVSAKEAKNRRLRCGKHLGSHFGYTEDYSADSVAIGYCALATAQRGHEKGTACSATAGCPRGNPTRPKPQDLLRVSPPLLKETTPWGFVLESSTIPG